jgi:hypothetical protein
MMDFIKNNMLIIGVVLLLIVIAIFFMMRKTSTNDTKDGKVKSPSSFTIFKKRLDDSKSKPAVLASSGAVLNTEEANVFLTQIGNDLCGKPFDVDKVESYMKMSSDTYEIRKQLGLSDLSIGLDINTVIVVAIMKSTMSEDKKIDYIATMFLDILLKTRGEKVIEYNKEKGEVKIFINPFREYNFGPSAEVISFQEFGNLCYKFMKITVDPVELRETLLKRNMPQESRDAEVAVSQKIFNAISVEKVCSMLT